MCWDRRAERGSLRGKQLGSFLCRRTQDLASNSLPRHLLKRKQVHEGLRLTRAPQHSHPKPETQPPATVSGHPHRVLLLSNEKEPTTDGAMGASQRLLGEER